MMKQTLCLYATLLLIFPLSASALETGQRVYEQYCSVCHRDGLLAAPKFRDSKDWAPRLQAKSIESLVDTVSSGLNAMPEKGTCVECSRQELEEAIKYMVPRS